MTANVELKTNSVLVSGEQEVLARVTLEPEDGYNRIYGRRHADLVANRVG